MHFVSAGIKPFLRSEAPLTPEEAKALRRPAALGPVAAKVLAQLREMSTDDPRPRPKVRARRATDDLDCRSAFCCASSLYCT